ncbi:MAG: AMP-binding enzyme [Janthinobacterium lividum]
MFFSGGENIFPGDVERMPETHPGIQQASVVGIDDEIKGTKPVAFVVRSVPAGALREDAMRRLRTSQA